ncbi:hypothetical protein APHNP_0803 [Anaplasma phagocytophilum str. ApNP]|uniref:Uncharacterized protein n=1 Tax=Anaplasma phagocytophilum str. ApNP TaxID=1359153 RepID=A0A0F3NFC4_ANAPH|nr:hypothetical protein APHNP_0803 [Anaplasma phagocytophilum str. ApNP]
MDPSLACLYYSYKPFVPLRLATHEMIAPADLTTRYIL